MHTHLLRRLYLDSALNSAGQLNDCGKLLREDQLVLSFKVDTIQLRTVI